MDNIEFIAAKDLPETEAKAVDVLCVDPATGAMARKAGASLGGSSSMVIKLNPETDSMGSSDSGVQFAINSVSYDEVVPVVMAGGSVSFDVSAFFGGFSVIQATAYGYVPATDMDTAYFTCMALFYESGNVLQVPFTFPNGTWTPPTAETTE